jgi:6-pyruvoyl-tetrahydropterin synthase
VTQDLQVARLYRFTATHHVDGLSEPWNKPHVHNYTLEIVGQGEPDENGIIIDTDLWDAELAQVLEELDGGNLNEIVGGPTTVEDLARHFLAIMEWEEENSMVVQATVWEDDERWGRATV